VQIKVSELREICENLFNHLDNISQSNIDIDKDFYWNIPEENLYDLSSEPTEFNVGQISDDWMELKKIGSKESEPLGYALVWLSSIMRVIGEKVVK